MVHHRKSRPYAVTALMVYAALIFGLCGGAAQASPASAQTAAHPMEMFRISGQVVNPPAEANVRALHPDGAPAGETALGQEGQFASPPLPVKAYTLEVLDSLGRPVPLSGDSQAEVRPEEKTAPRFHELTVVSPTTLKQTPTAVVAAGTGTASITGTVTAQDSGLPISNVLVEAVSVSGYYASQYGTTDMNGSYSITGLSSGNYKLHFRFYSAETTLYSPEWYDGSPDQQHATAIAVENGETRTGINATLDIGGQITGTVTAMDGGTPLENVYVFVYIDPSGPVCGSYPFGNRGTPPCSELAFDYTDASGAYTITGLQTGNYYLHFSRSEYLPLFYDNRTSPLGADPVHAVLGETSGNIDAALVLGGIIAGHLIDAEAGTPLQGVSVYAYESNTAYEGWSDIVDYAGYALTDAAGVYAIRGLPTGHYYMKFSKPDYLFSYYDGHSKLLDADPVTVEAAETTGNIDASLALGGKITGRVTAAVGGSALSGVSVDVYDSSSTNPWNYVTQSVTDTAGDYTVTGLDTGQYFVRFENWQYRPGYYNNKLSLSLADGVSVTRAETTTNINASLDAWGKISGVVKDASSGAPIQGAKVNAILQPGYGYIKNEIITDSNGFYTMDGLEPGNYSFGFSKAGYLHSYYQNKPDLSHADVISLTYNSLVEHVDAALSAGGTITGKVTSAESGEPLKDVAIFAYDNRATHTYVAFANTDDSGIYSLTGLETGEYYLDFGLQGFAPTVYNNKSSLAEADPVSVSAGHVTGQINVTLGPGGRIRGRVTSAQDGSPLAGIFVYAFSTTEDMMPVVYPDWVSTDLDGRYTIQGLDADTYQVQFQPPEESDYIPQYYNYDATDQKALLVSVGLNSLVDHIDATLVLGGRISGFVVGKDGVPLVDVEVSVTHTSIVCGESQMDYSAGATTDNTGHYIVRKLPTGTYQAGFWPYRSTSLYLGEYYNDQSSPELADDISVIAGETTNGIDAVLSQGGAITGRLTAADTGEGVGATVIFYNNSASGMAHIDKYEDEYVMQGLEPGSYKIFFSPWERDYAPEYYNDRNSLALADSIAIASGEVLTGIDGSLSQGGHFTGQLTDAADGDPVEWMEVDVYDTGGNRIRSGRTNSSGMYTTGAVSTGSYRLGFTPAWDGASDYLGEYYDYQTTLESADFADITAPSDTVVNAVLERGGSISGHVKDARIGTPLPNFNVVILDGNKNEIRREYSIESGYYTVRGLPTGTYYVNFFMPGVCPLRTFDLYYNQKSDLALADPVNVFAPGLHDGVDAFITQNYLFFPVVGR